VYFALYFISLNNIPGFFAVITKRRDCCRFALQEEAIDIKYLWPK